MNSNFEAVVVISAVSGGIATKLAASSSTFLGQIPISFLTDDIPDTIINFNSFWGIKVLGINVKKSTAQIAIIKNRLLSLRTYRRTHHLMLVSDGVDSWDIINIVKPEDDQKRLRAIDEYNRIRAWRLNGQPIRNLRELINT